MGPLVPKEIHWKEKSDAERTLRWIWPSAAFDSHDLNERPAVRAFQTIFMDTGMRGDCRLIHPGALRLFAGAMPVGSSSFVAA